MIAPNGESTKSLESLERLADLLRPLTGPLLPDQLTDEMLSAGVTALVEADADRSPFAIVSAIYTAMRAARPVAAQAEAARRELIRVLLGLATSLAGI